MISSHSRKSVEKVDDIDLIISTVRALIVQAPVVRLVSNLAVRSFQHLVRRRGPVFCHDCFGAPGFVEIAFKPFEDVRHVGFVLVDQEFIEIGASQPRAIRACNLIIECLRVVS